VFAALTTVTIDSAVLDSGLSAVYLSLLTSVNPSLPNPLNGGKSINIASAATVNLATATGNEVHITGSTGPITSFGTVPAGTRFNLIFDSTPTITYNATSMILNTGGTSYTAAAGDRAEAISEGSGNWIINITPISGLPLIIQNLQVRQTVISGPVDTAGLPSFGGSTGSTTVTASGTLISTASNGFNSIGSVNRIGSITNPSWTGLSTNGTMYLYLDIAADSTCTTGSTTLAPTYRWGGADVTTNNQFTFNIQEMVGKVGNGSVATQTYRVFVGEVTVAGAVVTVITWYALQGRYDGAYTSTLPGTATSVSRSHNIGVVPTFVVFEIKCLTTDQGFAVGDVVIPYCGPNASYASPLSPSKTTLVTQITTGSTNAFIIGNKTTGAANTLTAANWSYHFTAQRGW
jgi:hypothetical protein